MAREYLMHAKNRCTLLCMTMQQVQGAHQAMPNRLLRRRGVRCDAGMQGHPAVLLRGWLPMAAGLRCTWKGMRARHLMLGFPTKAYVVSLENTPIALPAAGVPLVLLLVAILRPAAAEKHGQATKAKC